MSDTKVQTIDAAIETVTVYNDRAKVTRRGQAKLGKGRTTLQFTGLTAGLDDGSVRVRLPETRGVRIIGITADWEGRVEVVNPEEGALRKEIEALQEQLQNISNQQTALGLRVKLLQQYQQHARDSISRKAAESDGASGAWGESLQFLSEDSSRTRAETRALSQQANDLNDELQAKQSELTRMRAPAARQTRRVDVILETDEALDATLVALDYVVFDAGWRAAYDVRADGNGAALELTYYGTITQGTGEDWERVNLTLSTARPSESAQIPTLTPIHLTGYKREKRPVQIVSYGKARDKSDEKLANEAPRAAEEPVPGGGGGGAFGNADGDGRAAVEGDDGPGLTFVIKGAESIPADRRPHKVEITTAKLEPEIGYETIPKIAPWVYLKATAKNTTEFPILAGPVNVFGASGFVGAGSLEHIAPGEQFSVSLGTDEHVKVRRIIDERIDSKPRILGSTRSLSYAYRIKVSNFRTEATRLTVVENVPVSEREELKVVLSDETTRPTEKNDDGFVKWTMTLAPEEEKTLEFGYEVTYPKDWSIGGL